MTKARDADVADPQVLEIPKPPLPALANDTVTSDTAVRLPRQGTKQTGEDLLEASIRLVNAFVSGQSRSKVSPVDLLPFIELEHILYGASALAKERLEDKGKLLPEERVAPLTSGAFYKAIAEEIPLDLTENAQTRGHTLNAFKRYVVAEIVHRTEAIDADAYRDFVTELVRRNVSLTEITRISTEIGYKNWQRSPASFLLGLLSFCAASDPVAARWGREVQEQQYLALEDLYEALLPVVNRKMKDGLSVRNMAVVVADLVAGMAISSRVSPEAHNDPLPIALAEFEGESWSLCSRAIWAIYDSFTELVQAPI